MEQKTEQKTWDNIEIGTIEKEKLSSKQVVITEYKIDKPVSKEGKEFGDILVLRCKHPDKTELIEISKAKYEPIGGTLKVGGLWLSKDEEGKIYKGSAVAHLLRKLRVGSIIGLKNQTIDTTEDSAGYLVMKAY